MTGLIGALRVSLGADTANFEKGMKRARGEMAAMQKASAALKTAFVGMAGLLAFDQFASLAKAGLDYASSLGEVAAQLGVSTRALQEYRYAASQAGIEQAEMDKALEQLTRRLGDAAQGVKEPLKALERLGVTVRDNNGHVRDAGETIPLIAEGLKSIESPAERAAILVDLFGRAGQKLAPLLEGGAEGVNNLRNAAHKLGIVLSDSDIQNADDAADKLSAVKQVLEAKIAGVVARNAKEIANLAEKLLNLAENAIKAANAMAKWVDQSGPGRGDALAENNRIRRANQNNAGNGTDIGVATIRPAAGSRGVWLPGQPGDARVGSNWTRGFRPGLPKGGRGGGRAYDERRLDERRRTNAFGANAFGGDNLSRFMPGVADPGWIKTATKGYADIAARASEAAAANSAAKAELAEMAKEHGPRLLASVKALAPAMEELRARAQGILDRLFPEEAEARQFKEELGILDAAMAKGALTTEDHRRAVEALRHEFTGLAEAMREAVNIETVAGPSIEDMSERIADGAADALDATRKNAEVTKVEVVKTFGDMARETLNELDRLSNAIRSGGFFDILSGLLGVGFSLGEAGLFGKTFQSNIKSIQGRAFGGPVMANQPYIVGERRAELFVPSTSGRIEPNPGNGRRGGGDTYHFSGNLLTPEWWAQIQKGFDEAAVRGAMGGAQLVSDRSQKQARQRLGRSR